MPILEQLSPLYDDIATGDISAAVLTRFSLIRAMAEASLTRADTTDNIAMLMAISAAARDGMDATLTIPGNINAAFLSAARIQSLTFISIRITEETANVATT
jgi:hypothetical protein